MAKVLLGMSGGVDSTVAAALLREAGHSVCGITFIMHGDGAYPEDAARAAEQAGADFAVRDIRAEFEEKVCGFFAAEYAAGRTPNPCIRCNSYIKFPKLLEYADENGFDYIATGHYASVISTADGFRISEAADKAKDQSYFLYSLGQNILSRLLLPLSGMTKEQVRAYAGERGFAAASRHDSQDICFIPDGDTTGWLEGRLGSGSSAVITDMSGKLLGTGKGVLAYTVGQRRGLGISAASRLFVTRIIPDENRVVLCREDELYRSRVLIDSCVFPGTVPASPFRADVRLRYTKRPAPALLSPAGDGILEAVFDGPQRAPAPGQAAVFYLTDGITGRQFVAGGGRIVKSE